MGIRFKYDVAALPMVSSGSDASRRFGQGMVLQQRKYDLETKQLQQQQSFQNARDWENRTNDLVRDERQKAFIQDRDAQNFQQMQDRDAQNFGQQKELMAEQRNQQVIDRANAMQIQADEQARQARRADIAQGIANGEIDPVTARELKDIDMAEIESRGSKSRLDAGQQADAQKQFDDRRAELLKNRLPPKLPPTADEHIAGRTSSDGKRRIKANGDIEDVPQPVAVPRNAMEAFNADKKLKDHWMGEAAKEEVLEPGSKLNIASRAKRAMELWQEEQSVLNPAPVPPQSGQVVPPAQGQAPAAPQATPPIAPAQAAPAAPQAAQPVAPPNIEPGYSATGESQVQAPAAQPQAPQAQAAPAAPQAAPPVAPPSIEPGYSDTGESAAQGQDLHALIRQQQEEANAAQVAGGDQFTDAELQAMQAKMDAAPRGRGEKLPPLTPPAPAWNDGPAVPVRDPKGVLGNLSPAGDIGPTQMAMVDAMRRAAPVVPDGTVLPQSNAVVPPVTDAASVKPVPPTAANPVPAAVPLAQAMQAIETGTPAEKKAARQGIDPQMVMGLKQQALAGDPEAIKKMDALKQSIAKQDEHEAMMKGLQSQDPIERQDQVASLQKKLKEGYLQPKEAISRLADSQGKKPTEMFDAIVRSTDKSNYSAEEKRSVKAKRAGLNALWDEMGMFGPNDTMWDSAKRAVKGNAKEEDVINHVAKQGKMSKADAKEYVYKEILARNYMDDVIGSFSKELDEAVRKKKQDDKVKNWKPT